MRNRSIIIKAAFLLTVFAMNTVVGFACASFDIFHSLHHHRTAATAKHGHNGKMHQHQHKDGHHGHADNDGEQKRDCCSGTAVSFEKLAKSPGRTIGAPPVDFVTAFVFAYLIYPLNNPGESNPFPRWVRWRVPATIQDLRIVIQSFQI